MMKRSTAGSGPAGAAACAARTDWPAGRGGGSGSGIGNGTSGWMSWAMRLASSVGSGGVAPGSGGGVNAPE